MGTLDDLIRERVSAVLDRVLTEKIDGALRGALGSTETAQHSPPRKRRDNFRGHCSPTVLISWARSWDRPANGTVLSAVGEALAAVLPFNSSPMPRDAAAKAVLNLLGREFFASPDKAEIRISGVLSDLFKLGYIRYGNPTPAHRVGEAY